MKPIGSASFEYRGKAGGVAAEKHDDVLTLKMGNQKGEILFERAGNKSVWQKVRNSFNQKTKATLQDVVGFLTSRGMDEATAKTAAKNITMNNGAISARGFEEILEGRSTYNKQSLLKTDWERDAAAYKSSQTSQ